ncbi:MAG: signal recognition particle protein [Nitrospirae bacterium]|nr:signal recognition particle protein [Nitrospirota bacterium]
MFESLTAKLDAVLKKFKGKGILTEKDLQEGLREVRLALLEADVNFKVVKVFIDRIRDRAMGQEVMESLTPGQQVVKIVFEELCSIMGEKSKGIQLSPVPPTVIMLLGLQGSGKTTTAGKMAKMFRQDGRRPLLVAADIRRPAAVKQLSVLGEALRVPIYTPEGGKDAVAVCSDGVEYGRMYGHDVVILDTAGRLHIDDELMDELIQIKNNIKPHELLLVVDAMTGQDAVNIATHFDKSLDITGVILTKMDGDARGGAVLSVRHVTGKPIRLLGVGEKLDQLEPFFPDRMASRILGMGDVLSLIEKAQDAYSVEEVKNLKDRLKGDGFTLEDFRAQMKQLKRLGSLTDLIAMIPGGRKILQSAGGEIPEDGLKRVEAIISSMTVKERLNHTVLNGSRRKRIAKGSGTSVEEINRLLKQFLEARKMMKGLAGEKGKLSMLKKARRLFS